MCRTSRRPFLGRVSRGTTRRPANWRSRVSSDAGFVVDCQRHLSLWAYVSVFLVVKEKNISSAGIFFGSFCPSSKGSPWLLARGILVGRELETPIRPPSEGLREEEETCAQPEEINRQQKGGGPQIRPRGGLGGEVWAGRFGRGGLGGLVWRFGRFGGLV